MVTISKPVVVIVDASVAVTGAVVSAARQADLLSEELTTVLPYLTDVLGQYDQANYLLEQRVV